MEPRITLAIPFHSGVAYLREAIESVLAQREERWRLLVVDDLGEPGRAGDLVAGFADGRIEHRANQTNLGMAANWNRCLDLARTDLVTLLHADDRLHPGYVDTVLTLAQRHSNAVALFCGAEVIGHDGKPRFSLEEAVKRMCMPRRDEIVLAGEDGVRRLLECNFVMCPTLCYRKSVLGERRFAERWRQVQDLELTTRLLFDAEILVGTRDVAYAYRRHGRGATAIQSETLLRFEEEFELYERVAVAATARGWTRAAAAGRRKHMPRLHLLIRLFRDLCRLRGKAARQKWRLLRSRPAPAGHASS